MPKGIVVSSSRRRFFAWLIDLIIVQLSLGAEILLLRETNLGLLCLTPPAGYLVWTLVVWGEGQTPGKQVLGMRVARLDTRSHAGWEKMFMREIVIRTTVVIASCVVPFIGSVIVASWLLWDKDNQQLWDKAAGTVVINDRKGLA